MQVARDMILATEVQEKITKGGIIVPDTHVDKERARTLKVRVVAVGPGVVNVLPDGSRSRLSVSEAVGSPVGVGTLLVITRYVQKVNIGGVEYKMFQASDVSAVITEDEL